MADRTGQESLWTGLLETADDVVVIAEAGVNHDGDVSVAHRLVDVAAACGADAVKFQTFDPDLLVTTTAQSAPYQGRRRARGQHELLRSLVLPPTAWRELAQHAQEQGLTFLSTGFDRASVHHLLQLGVTALKAPSGEINNLPFLRMLAHAGLPLLVSTGTANLAEVASAVAATSTAPLRVLLHCVTAYPTPIQQTNLRAMQTMHRAFGLPVGWSDHTVGAVSATIAVALGARVLEKHFTLDRRREGPDHAASEDPRGLAAYVQAVRDTSAALGNGDKEPAESELHNIVHARRSWYITRELTKGHILGPQDVVALRPAIGIPPSITVEGYCLTRPKHKGDALMDDDVKPRS